MENQYELNAADTGGDAVALIDIGASVMKTNVIRGGASIFARDIPFGGHNYTQAIAQRLNIPFEKAEVAKVGRAAGVNWDDMVPALDAVSRELSHEVQRTFDYFASTAESERIGKIVLSGGCARLPGLDESLSFSCGIPDELVRPFQNVNFNTANGAELVGAAPVRAIAEGNRYKPERDDLERRVNAIEELTKNQTTPIYFLEAVAESIPRDRWLTSTSERDRQLHFNGTAFSSTALADFMANLRASGRFKDVDLVVARQDI